MLASLLAWNAYNATPAGHQANTNLANQIEGLWHAKKDSEQNPKNSPTGALPIDKDKGKSGSDKDDVHGIKERVGAGPKTWTDIAQNRDVWTGSPGGVGENHGPYGRISLEVNDD
ncbi:hypothetical protein FHT05_001896 [Xanthomonas arboricola]|uniref:hypothetical protein n=1 Tax=Xanthomonas arboricola TaxID=56448 RepID=UPI0011B07B98|nr:hypothetical protein [Xanthomonas arboricola]MBB6257312.1 hypothetical protein [Xanthomonas arboricola]